MIWKKPYVRVMIQIILVMTISFTFSFIIHEADKGLVSASENFISTCLKSNNGEICQEFPAETCDELCNGTCVKNSRENVAECRLGTCYNPIEGDCLTNSPKKSCEDFGGNWSLKNIPECELGCCLTAEQSYFITEQKCKRIQETTGVLTDFKPEINNEFLCWAETRTQAQGACVLNENCKFATKLKCSELNGEFYENYLCSNPDLETNCEKQITTSCVEGLDEVYWIDSCGNKENIYEGSSLSQKEHSWNNGKVLLKSESCVLNKANSDTCGNCNLLLNSYVCGNKTFTEKLKDSEQDVVCKQASCVDNNGNLRQHGESWCYYQGAVNPDKGDRGYLRSVSTPGSRHFKLWCYQGEIYNVSCGDKRDLICEESRITSVDGEKISNAVCRTNTADLCIQYNAEDNGMKKCGENPDCYVKKIDVKDAKVDFKFCVPKIPKGFNLEDNPEYAKSVCGIANIKCTVAKIKKVGDDEWKNKGCFDDDFTKQINDFCMSLGDCGASANYIGEFSDSGYRVRRADKLSDNYIDDLEDYSKNTNEILEASSINSISGSLGLNEIGFVDKEEFEKQDDITQEEWWTLGNLGAGIGGMLLFGAAQSGVTTVVPGMLIEYGTLTPWLGALGGAVIGATVAGTLISQLEIGAGLPPALAYSLIGLGAVGGGLIATSLLTTPGGLFASATGPVGISILVGVIITTIVFKLIGIGKAKYYKVEFTCKPWQAPVGGDDCSKCGSDGFGCSKYACESLGAGCQFINEGTKFEECKYIPSDSRPPQISPNSDVEEKFKYEEITDNGFKITSSQGCIPAFSLVNIGLTLNEPGRCTIFVEDKAYNENEILDFLDESEYSEEDFALDKFLGEVEEDDSLQKYELEGLEINPGMSEFYFGGNNLFLINHTHRLVLPSLASLGIGGYGPDRKVDFELRVRCEDTDGNKNPKDYVIKTCLIPEKDIFPPIILSSDPLDNFVKANATSSLISIYTNEPSECKYSFQDKSYDSMEYLMSCDNDADEITARGFKCSSEINVEDIIYFRCKDQPWLKGTVNESERHSMEKSYNISLKNTPELKIDSIYPENEILDFGQEPGFITLEIKTSEGVDNGNAECFYNYQGNWVRFFDTFDDEHSQEFNQLNSGKKEIEIRCKDRVNNEVYEKIKFTIKIDNSAPEIIRIFKQNQNLEITTNEKAICYYDFRTCNFDIENASSMSFGLSTTHSIDWDKTKTYYIKCIDKWKNWNSGCSKIIQPES